MHDEVTPPPSLPPPPVTPPTLGAAPDDEQQLKLLSIFHYIVGGMAGLCALIPVIHLIIGIIFVVAPEGLASGGNPPPPAFGWFFIIFASVAILLGLVFAGLILATGRFLGQRKRYTFCFVVACVECLFMPFGTVLGIFTIIVLLRDSVKRRFGVEAAAA